jgi:uncharacterized phiE125 gp8 family phage protein
MPDVIDVAAYPWPIAEPLWRYGVQSHVDLVAGPTAEPIDLASTKLHLRVTNSAEDAYISRLITACRDHGEYYTRRSWMPQTLALVMDRFPWAGARGHLGGLGLGVGSTALIRVERPPVTAITSITYYDEAGDQQTLDPSTYQVDLPRGPRAQYARIRPVGDTVWPDTERRRLDAVTVTYQAGYALAGSPPASTVPAELIQGMFLMIGELYKTRTESVNDYMTPALRPAQNLWASYRVW